MNHSLLAYLYILYSETLDKYYVGHTTLSPEERLKKHLSDHDGYTAKDGIVQYSKTFEDKKAAFARERQIKAWKSRRKIEALIREKI